MTPNAPPPQSKSLNLDQALQQAIACHQAGESLDAERLYLAILDLQPNHPDANHNLGVLLFQNGRRDDGLAHFKTALEANPGHGQYWLSYIDALTQSGQLDAAQAVLEQGMQLGLAGEPVEALARILQSARQANSESRNDSRAQAQSRDKSARSSGKNPGKHQIDAVLSLFAQGRLVEVEAMAKAMTGRYPGHAFGWKALGAVYTRLGRHTDALVPMQKAAALSPSDAEAHCNLGVALQLLGRLAEAEASYRMALRIKPDFPDAHCKLGVTLKDLGRLADAEASLTRALQLRPDYVEAYSNLAIVLKDQGRLVDAESACRRAIEIKPDFAEAYYNLGCILQNQGRLPDAEAGFKCALQLRPDWPEALNNLGNVLRDLGRLAEAQASFRDALQAKPDYAEAHSNLGNALRDMGRLDEAEIQLRQALQFKPDSACAHNNLGNVQKEIGQLELAEASYRQALLLDPEYAQAYGNLGIVQKDLGRLDLADASYRRALQLKPDYSEAYSNLLFLHGYCGLSGPVEYLDLARNWERSRLPEPDRQAACRRVFQRPPLAARRLRVGYMSGDYRQHAVSCFVEQLFAHHDRSRIELFAYSTCDQQDDVTGRLQRLAEHWVQVAGMSDSAIRDLIEADGIDLLVDLSGHTRHNRLGVFALRAAPVQAHYLGFFASTGLTEMDYWIGDEILTPAATDGHFSEQVFRLPRVWVSYDGRADAPLSDWRPDSDGSIWLGSFNHLGKLTAETLALWAKALHLLPEGKLLLKTRELDCAENRQRILDSLALHGISPDRIALVGRSATPDWHSHMSYYDRLDIALDPVGGVGGGTTTCDALWMGVPLITLAGDRVASRMSASMLSAIGCQEWIAGSKADYVAKVIALARDPELRKAARSSQRERMAASPLCDARNLAGALEDAYFEMFEKWRAAL